MTTRSLELVAIGKVMRLDEEVWLQVEPEFEPALLGLDEFSHLWLFYWFDRNDRPSRRATLQVHPRRDPKIPLHGVFATRAPVRPNLIGVSLCALLSLRGTRIRVDHSDALHGSPILDIKPYLPNHDIRQEATVPEWINRPPPTRRGDPWHPPGVDRGGRNK
jgi:tRNA-Thr(GGU) m(6)t(6)A37 methyltransferase TsaA